MAVKKCKECGGQVSTSAKTCPHCGANQKKVGVVGWLFVLVFVLPLGWSIGSSMNNDSPAGTSANTAKSGSTASNTDEDLSPKWKYFSFEDDLSGDTVKVASLYSTNSITFSFPYRKSGGSRLELNLRKKPNDFEAYFRIEKGQILCSSIECKFKLRIGDRPVQTWTGLPSTTHDSDIMFIRDAKDFRDIVATGTPLRIGIEFYQAGRQTFWFETEGYNSL